MISSVAHFSTLSMANSLISNRRVAQQQPPGPTPTPPSTSSSSAPSDPSGSMVMVGEHALRQEALAALSCLVESLLIWFKQANVNANAAVANGASLEGGAVPVANGANAAVANGASLEGGAVPAAAAEEEVLEDVQGEGRKTGEGWAAATIEASPPPPPLSASTTSTSSVVNQELAARRAYKARFNDCVALFNVKPRKGLDALIKEGMVGSSAEEVAAFLARGQGLDKTMIGDFLGEREDFSLKVRKYEIIPTLLLLSRTDSKFKILVNHPTFLTHPSLSLSFPFLSGDARLRERD